jgi:hypothetical protein
MYTKEQYLLEKSMMTKQERMIQERFEKMIEILILYKQENQNKEVFLSDKCVGEAVNWFQKNMGDLIQKIQNE